MGSVDSGKVKKCAHTIDITISLKLLLGTWKFCFFLIQLPTINGVCVFQIHQKLFL